MASRFYNVISPDGLPMSPEPFATEQEARDFVARWCEQYRQQGYYSAVTGRIPLEELPKTVRIVQL